MSRVISSCISISESSFLRRAIIDPAVQKCSAGGFLPHQVSQMAEVLDLTVILDSEGEKEEGKKFG